MFLIFGFLYLRRATFRAVYFNIWRFFFHPFRHELNTINDTIVNKCIISIIHYFLTEIRIIPIETKRQKKQT